VSLSVLKRFSRSEFSFGAISKDAGGTLIDGEIDDLEGALNGLFAGGSTNACGNAVELELLKLLNTDTGAE
jgi:hypothetical protein